MSVRHGAGLRCPFLESRAGLRCPSPESGGFGRWDRRAAENLAERADVVAAAEDGQSDRRGDRRGYEDRHP